MRVILLIVFSLAILSLSVLSAFAQDEKPEKQFWEINPITIIVSGIALTLSIITLWHNYLAPFNLKISHTTPHMSIYEYDSVNEEGKGWWFPSIYVVFSFYNAGKKSGEVKNIRFQIKYEPIDKTKSKKYGFYAKWHIKPDIFEAEHSVRTKWLEDAIISSWYPELIPGKEKRKIHLILEGSPWDTKKKGKLDFDLEISTSANEEWKKIESYSINIDPMMFTNPAMRWHLENRNKNREEFDNNEVYPAETKKTDDPDLPDFTP